jgi:hypothetical protein
VTDETVLPAVVHVNQAFASRAPTQRVIDTITRMEGGTFGDIATQMPFRLTAFRALLRDYPGVDPQAAWLHAYDVEVEIADTADPFSNGSTTVVPPSVSTTEYRPPTSTG